MVPSFDRKVDGSLADADPDRRNLIAGFAAATALLAALLSVSGCGGTKRLHSADSGESSPLRVVATTGMIADLVLQIGGPEIELIQLIQVGVDPHLYKPIRDDVVAILAADLVFYNGLQLEGRMTDLLAKANRDGRTTVALSDSMPKEWFLGEPGTDAMDPHLWMDVAMWTHATKAIEAALIHRLPKRKPEFEARASALRLRLDELDRRGREAIETIPERQRVLISSHDAFQYFGRRYGLQVEGVQGMSTASEAGLQRIPQLLELVVTRSVPAVFKESSVAGKLIDALVEGADARGVSLNIGNELYSDALGPKGSGGDSYEGMMTHNFKTVTLALGGTWN